MIAHESNSSRSNVGLPRLVICTAMTAQPGKAAGSFVLTRKFLDGVREYCRYWPGSVAVWVQRVAHGDSNLDHIEVHPSELPFRLHWIEGEERDEGRFLPAMQSADLILAALVDKHVCLAAMCETSRVPLVYVTEYSVKTRQQIVYAETRNPILRWRRGGWTTRLETAYREAVRKAAGVQCNGLPTYEAYISINNHCLLYFDTRVRADQLVAPATLEMRLAELQRGKPLRLAFSGRLIAMKGVDHLPLVAAELKRRKVPFIMDICGGGALEQKLRDDVLSFALEYSPYQVRVRGVLDFEKQLLPFIAGEIDLFVCCHRQGDPSCTYLETYSCGVPIVGYDNEALAGLAETANVGGTAWVTPLDDPVTLAAKIADLSHRRDQIAAASHNALVFAARHTFEHTMKNRVQHMLDCLERQKACVRRHE